jgi:hypothetical protein
MTSNLLGGLWGPFTLKCGEETNLDVLEIMDYDILFILANFQKSCLNKCRCVTNFWACFYTYIANLIDKLGTRSFGTWCSCSTKGFVLLSVLE